tara:strand:- start:123 stop:425 length:303 start_codon:yes stop_codon:yes gene_type:complete
MDYSKKGEEMMGDLADAMCGYDHSEKSRFHIKPFNDPSGKRVQCPECKKVVKAVGLHCHISDVHTKKNEEGNKTNQLLEKILSVLESIQHDVDLICRKEM